jgi:hypothetical protein
MFHSGLWGGWQYSLRGMDSSAHTLNMGYGGFQECRGSGASKQHYYVENIFEELDTAGEWYLDQDSSTLYLYPNTTTTDSAHTTLADSDIVISELETLIRIEGGAGDTVRTEGGMATGIQFNGFEFTETRSTFLEQYECPSGGDW